MTLKQELRLLLSLARQHEGTPQRRTLPRGLLIVIAQLRTGDIQLTLERSSSEPSDLEWSTVLKHWPEPVPAGVVSTRRKEGRRYIMVGRWARPLELLGAGSPPAATHPEGQVDERHDG